MQMDCTWFKDVNVTPRSPFQSLTPGSAISPLLGTGSLSIHMDLRLPVSRGPRSHELPAWHTNGSAESAAGMCLNRVCFSIQALVF